MPAVDATVLDEKTIASHYDKEYFSFSATCFPNIVPPGGLSKGEVACFLSHRKCWQQIVEGIDEYSAIFEDDVIFSDKSAQYLQETDWIPEDADIVKLEVMTRKLIVDKVPAKKIDERVVTRFYTTNVGAAAYILSRNAAEKLLKMTERFYLPVDHVLFGHFFPYFEKLVCYQVIPALCIQEKELNGNQNIFKSTLSERDEQVRNQNARRLSVGIKTKREIIRLYHQVKALSGSRKNH